MRVAKTAAAVFLMLLLGGLYLTYEHMTLPMVPPESPSRIEVLAANTLHKVGIRNAWARDVRWRYLVALLIHDDSSDSWISSPVLFTEIDESLFNEKVSQ
jgi:hypothetical protein